MSNVKIDSLDQQVDPKLEIVRKLAKFFTTRMASWPL